MRGDKWDEQARKKGVVREKRRHYPLAPDGKSEVLDECFITIGIPGFSHIGTVIYGAVDFSLRAVSTCPDCRWRVSSPKLLDSPLILWQSKTECGDDGGWGSGGGRFFARTTTGSKGARGSAPL